MKKFLPLPNGIPSHDTVEITAIPARLQMLEVAGCLVTIDAMGCQKEIARLIRARGGDYVLALKENQETLYQNVKLYLLRRSCGRF